MPRIKWRRGLYAITDTERFASENLYSVCEQALRGGAVILQYRDKSGDAKKRQTEALKLKKICHQHNAFLIIDNDAELCHLIEADGVHLGPNDMQIPEARQLLGPGKIIGASCHQSLKRAYEALQQTANYVSFGAFYTSKTRPDAKIIDRSLLKEITKLPIPSVAIGGINLARAEDLVHKGIDHIAVISDLWDAELFKKVSICLNHCSNKPKILFLVE